jgi:hypothetical protein
MLKKKAEEEKREEDQWRRADFLKSIEYDKKQKINKMQEDREARRNTIQGLSFMKQALDKAIPDRRQSIAPRRQSISQHDKKRQQDVVAMEKEKARLERERERELRKAEEENIKKHQEEEERKRRESAEFRRRNLVMERIVHEMSAKTIAELENIERQEKLREQEEVKRKQEEERYVYCILIFKFVMYCVEKCPLQQTNAEFTLTRWFVVAYTSFAIMPRTSQKKGHREGTSPR